MGLSIRPLLMPRSCVVLLVSCSLIISSFAEFTPDCNRFVFNHCANETFAEDATDSYSKSLFSLFENLTAQSLQSKFYKTTSVSEGNSVSVSGLFQCREDLSSGDCHNCVKKLPEATKSACPNTKSARVQLSGCYVSYSADEDGIPEVPETESRFRYKKCEEHEELPFGFRELMDAGFLELEHGMENNHDGYYSTNYDLVHMLAQCEGEFRGCECAECISHAVQIAQGECEHSTSGEVYMDHCYMSYNYYPHGIPHEYYPDERDREYEYDDEHGISRTVAIVLGAVAAVVLIVILLLCLKSTSKKGDDC